MKQLNEQMSKPKTPQTHMKKYPANLGNGGLPPNFLSPYFLVFRGCSTGPACQCLFETLVLDSHACPRRSGFETRKTSKSPHSCHQAPQQLPLILRRGRSKPSLRYPKGSVHPPTALLPTPPPNPPPPKKTQILGTNPDMLSPKCFMHLAKFSGQPQKIRDNLKTAERGCP